VRLGTGQASEHSLGLLKPHIRHLGAVAGVPAKRCASEPSRIVDHQEDELERVREAHVVELGRCR
jgi:hypothetical protein